MISKSSSIKITSGFISSILGIGLLVGCNTKEIGSDLLGNAVSGDTYMNADIDGKAWEADLGAHYISLGNGISITGMGNGLQDLLTLALESAVEGEYRVNSSFSLSLSRGDEFYLAKSGIITITKKSGDTIEGTFMGDLKEDAEGSAKTIKITNGRFRTKPADSVGQ